MIKEIALIPLSRGLHIADHKEPEGAFICNYRGGGGQVYEAIYNEGDVFHTRGYTTYGEAKAFLEAVMETQAGKTLDTRPMTLHKVYDTEAEIMAYLEGARRV